MRIEPFLDLVDELAAALAVDRRDREHRTLPAVRFHERLHARGALLGRDEIELVQHEPARLGEERFVVPLQFAHDRRRVVHRVAVGIERRQVDDVEQEARALQMAQELHAEARTVGGALDQPGNVGDDKAARRVGAHDAEVRRERGERVIGDFRPRGRNGADERALAGIGHPEETDVGQHLELQAQVALFAFLARRELARRAIGARLEMQVAEPALAAARDLGRAAR